MRHPILSEKFHSLLHVPNVPGDVGIELEIEGENLPRSVTGWSRHIENSLRGKDGRVIAGGEDLPDTPQEYVTNGPILLSAVPNVLNSLCSKLVAPGTTVHLTNRASTHIHLNFGAETVQTLFNFILIFTIAEPTLLRLCGPARNGNLFCLPSYETGDLPVFITKLAQSATAHSLPTDGKITTVYREYVRATWPQRGKYAALNLDPLKTLGSVECRCFPNSIDVEQITGWAELLVKMRSFARELADDDPRQLIDLAYSDPMTFLSRVFPLSGIFSSCAPNHPAELVALGTEHAYEILCKMFFLLEYADKSAKRGKAKLLLDLDLANMIPDFPPDPIVDETIDYGEDD